VSDRVVAIIPAKGRSRRVPGKNLRPFNGEPLVTHTVRQALESRRLDEVYVSTDSQEIARLCEGLGARVPFLRAPEHSGDHVHSSVPILDMLERLGGRRGFAYCVSLHTTHPLRRTGTIDAVVDLALARRRNVLTVAPLGKTIFHLRTIGPDGSLTALSGETRYNFQTEDAPELLSLVGVAQCAPVEELLAHRTFQYARPLGYRVDPLEAFDIDTEADFVMVERLAERLQDPRIADG
jgi:CMP-N,N'-diacetyllegionaminic acid synthase